MKNNFKTLLIILVIILILCCGLIILYKPYFSNTLSIKAELPSLTENEFIQDVSADDALDLQILENKNFDKLQKNVSYFDIEEVCENNNVKNCSIGSAVPFGDLFVN